MSRWHPILDCYDRSGDALSTSAAVSVLAVLGAQGLFPVRLERTGKSIHAIMPDRMLKFPILGAE